MRSGNSPLIPSPILFRSPPPFPSSSPRGLRPPEIAPAMAPRKKYVFSGQGPCRMQWFLRVRRRRIPPPSRPPSTCSSSSSEMNPTASPPVNKRKAEESLLLESDSDGGGRGRKMRRGETSSSSSTAAAVRKTMTLEEIRALPPSVTRPFYPRTLLRGTRSIKQPQSWTCLMCSYVNDPTHHFLYDLPAFECNSCGAMPREGDTDFGFCFADLAANEACPIGNVKMQNGDECMANALSSCVEITDRVMMILLGQSPSKQGPYVNTDDLLSKYRQRWLDEGNKEINVYTGYSLLTMLRVFQVDGVNELETGESCNDAAVAPKLHKIPDWVWLDRNDFVALSSTLADGYPLICGFPTGPRFSYLEHDEIYNPPPPDSVGKDGKKPGNHCAVLVGAHQQGRVKWFYFLNSYDEDFCLRSEDKGNGIRSGVGAIEAGYFTLSPLQILRFNERKTQPMQRQ